MNEYLPTIGADPEAFIWDTEEEKIVSAEGILPGTKKKPHPLQHGAVQVDGIAAEFNVDPAQSSEEFVHNTESLKKQITEILHNTSKNLQLNFTSTAYFTPKSFKQFSKKELTVGCDPDYFVNKNELSRPFTNLVGYPNNYRFAGGHIHIGNIFQEYDGTKEQMEKASALAFFFSNKVLFVEYLAWQSPAQLLENVTFIKTPIIKNLKETGFNDTSPLKRKETIRSDLFRLKPYGVELRSYDNHWVSNPFLIKAQFQNVFLNACWFLQNNWNYNNTHTILVNSLKNAPDNYLKQEV